MSERISRLHPLFRRPKERLPIIGYQLLDTLGKARGPYFEIGLYWKLEIWHTGARMLEKHTQK